MLTCPQCEFENPDSNKFCQSCGTVLQSNSSLESERSIFNLATNKTETINAQTTFWAIISKHQLEQLETKSEEVPLTSNNLTLQITDLSDRNLEISSTPSSKDISTQRDSSLQTKQIYLDTQNRYRIDDRYIEDFNNFIHSNTTSSIIELAVIDEKLEQKTALANLQNQQPELFAELADNLDDSYHSVAQYWNLIGVPTQALPYLVLQNFTPTIPSIYDAWQSNQQAIVIFPNRSNWLLLSELWNDSELPFLQILWFFNELVKLWTPLSKVGCSQSLLIEENLRIDEDQSICLQKLYLDCSEKKSTLQDLVKTWQIWLQKSNRAPHQYQPLDKLIEQVIEGKVDTVEKLSLSLQELSLQHFDLTNSTFDTSPTSSDPLQAQKYSITQNCESESSVFMIEDSDELSFNQYEEDEELILHNDSEDQPTVMLPMELAEVIDASCTDIGTQREHNEDFFGVKTEIRKRESPVEKTLAVSGLYIVCDGMGGHAAGEVASRMAVNTLEEYFQQNWFSDRLPDAKTIETGILLTNQTLYQTNLDNARSGNGRMGTTMVMALLQDTNLAIAHVGDSRIYLVSRQRGLEQLTQDHEVGQREINRGVEPEIAYGRPDAYQLTQALGPRENRYIKPEIEFLEIKEDCLILLCSDGLCDNNFLEDHWQTYLTPLISSSANLEEGLFQLIDFANQYNGHDNITGVLVRIKLKPHF